MPNIRNIVLVANDVGGVGGMEKHLEEMIDRLKRTYQVTVVSSSLRLQDPTDVRFIRVPSFRKPFPLMITMFSLYASLRLMWLRKALRGDCIVHTTGSIVLCKADISTIHYCHAGWQHAVATDAVGNVSVSVFHRINSAIGLRMKLWMEKHCYRPDRTPHLVAVSKRIKAELADFYPYPNASVSVIPNGVDTNRFRPASAEEKEHLRRDVGLPAAGTYLVFMGGDWERKGVRFLLAAFNRLAEDYRNLHVLVVGPGDSEALLTLVPEPFRERVHFVGRQAYPERWYRLGDVFVFPSSYEACSLAVLEAAASGLTMLVSNVGGADDVVEDGLSGHFIERSAESIVAKVRYLLENLTAMQQTAQAVRCTVERMTWDDTYRQFLALYESVGREKEAGGFDAAETSRA